MSIPYTGSRADPLSLKAISEELLERASAEARNSPRKRSIIRFHEHQEPVQRMLNAIEPESYARPHRHLTKPEAFVALRGSLLVARYADDGLPLEGVLLEEGGPVKGVEIPPGAWHSILSLESGTVVYEVIQGPYDPATHKELAPWAPAEEDRDGGIAFMARVRAHFSRLIPQLAARNQIEAEEEEIC